MLINKLVMLSQKKDTVAAFGQSYVTWDFLDKYPRSMEPRYLHLNWDHIPGMYLRKYYLRTLVIEKEEWAHLSNPASLTRYWEPTQVPDDFHRTFALALCRTAFHNCEDARRRKEYVVSVGIVRKLAWHMAIPFASATDEFETTERTLLLLYWSGSIGAHGYFRTYTLTSTINILRSCMILGCPSTSVTPRGLWVSCFIMHSRLGISPLPKRSCLWLF